MNKRVVLILLLAISATLSARNKMSLDEDNYHFGFVTAGVGYSSLSCRADNVAVKGGLGYLFGAGYEFRRHGFWINAGLNLQHLGSEITVNEYVYTPPVGGMDIMGRVVNEYHYTVNQQDKQDWLTADIPVMAGYYNSGFYCGAGFKVSFQALSANKVTGTYAISADYDRYIGTVSDIHYYTTYSYEGSGDSYKIRPMFSVAGELGYDVLSSLGTNDRICHMLKVGLYFEYGIRSIKTATLDEPLTINPNDITDVTINPHFATEEGTSSWTVPYFVGVKVTYMIGGSRNATATWHKGCQCYGD